MMTNKDVAKMSGVSPSTVSRVITDNPKITSATKQKVRKAMKELGYYPNSSARNLVAKSTNTIGVILPASTNKTLQNPFSPEVLRGIGGIIHQMKYSMVLSTGETKDEIYDEVDRMLYGSYVVGIILLDTRLIDRILNFLREESFTFVMVGKPYDHNSEFSHVDN